MSQTDEEVVFVYYCEKTATIMAITEEYDAYLAVEYSSFCMPKSMTELALPPPPSEGYAYYDEQTGQVVCVSPRIFTPFEGVHPRLTIDYEFALRFVKDEEAKEDYFVDPNGRLMRIDGDYDIALIDANYSVLDEDPFRAPVTLRIRVATKDKTIAFKLDTMFHAMKLKTEIDTFEVLLTYRDDPSTILETFVVSLPDLIENKLIVRAISTDLKMHPAIFMKRFVPSTWLEVGPDNTDRMPLPAMGDDVVRFQRNQKDAALVARIDRKKKRVRLTYNRDAGPLYDRTLRDFPILITRPKDPSFILDAQVVPLEALLKSGKAEFALPGSVVKDEFDLHAPLFFKSMAVFDNLKI